MECRAYRSAGRLMMLTDPQLRSQVDALWDKLWAGGLSNPLDAIEQLSYLFFLKQLDERSRTQNGPQECAGSLSSRSSQTPTRV